MKILSTPRLRLDPVREDDLAPLHVHWTDTEVRRYLWDGLTVSEDRVREIIEESKRLFDEDGAGLWAIRRTTSTELIGCAGFWFFHEPPEREIVLSISPPHWGQGLARESAAALLTYAFDELRWPAVQGSADAPNSASLRLMRRLGMEPAGQRPGEFGTTEVFRITRDRW